jgi:hypothetical protein
LGQVFSLTGTNAVLDREGIVVGKFFGKRRFKWTEIKSVLVINAVSGKEVCLEVNRSASSKPALVRLPNTYGMEPDELAKTIVRWQREYGRFKSN